MKDCLKDKYCLIQKNKKTQKAKIINSFVQVGGPDHGKDFVSLILEGQVFDMWSREVTRKLIDVKLID
tara:strand:+ start:729 stop:932 length:204 start_codon:yes stop_codon:yes gene_type:complete